MTRRLRPRPQRLLVICKGRRRHQRVVARFIQRPYLRRVLVLVPVLVSDGSAVGDEGGT